MRQLLVSFLIGAFGLGTITGIQAPADGENYVERQFTSKCIKADEFVKKSKESGMKLVMYNSDNDPVIKMMFMNGVGESILVNYLPDRYVCILETYSKNSTYSSEFYRGEEQ